MHELVLLFVVSHTVRVAVRVAWQGAHLTGDRHRRERSKPLIQNRIVWGGQSFSFHFQVQSSASRRSFFPGIGGAQPSFKPQSPARDVKPFSMSSTRPVDLGGKGNPLIESIPDDVPLTRPTNSPNAIRLFRGMAFNPISIHSSKSKAGEWIESNPIQHRRVEFTHPGKMNNEAIAAHLSAICL